MVDSSGGGGQGEAAAAAAHQPHRRNRAHRAASAAAEAQLPVEALRDKFLAAVRDNEVLIVVGDTGSGKTTKLPQYLAQCTSSRLAATTAGAARRDTRYRCVACTQPRRVAAMSVSARVADEMRVKLGEQVGYSVRFEERSSPARTRIKYLTDGMLLRELANDRDASAYDAIMVDEAHERSLATDILLGMLKDILRRRRPRRQESVRTQREQGGETAAQDDNDERDSGDASTSTSSLPPLRVIISSATLNAQQLSEFFDGAPTFRIPGRRFPVDVYYTKSPEADHVEACVATALQIHGSNAVSASTRGGGGGGDGGGDDILVFLTGQDDIERAAEMLTERLASVEPGAYDELVIVPVYAMLPAEQQARIFDAAPPGARKVILATNIAETSITLPGVAYVVDSGMVKQRVFDALVVTPISRASAVQRAGRAGRVRAGHCYRVYTRAHFEHEMPAHSVPEIQRTDMAQTVLLLKSAGVADVRRFDYLDAPSEAALSASVALLQRLGALTRGDGEEGGAAGAGQALTEPVGVRMAAMPLEPRMARALIGADARGCASELLSVFAVLSSGYELFERKGRREHMLRFGGVDGVAASSATAAGKRRPSLLPPPLSDHMLMARVYAGWARADHSPQWCHEHRVHRRALERARAIRAQLERLVEAPDASRPGAVLHALLDGFSDHVARLGRGGLYRPVATAANTTTTTTAATAGTEVHVHPSSCLYRCGDRLPPRCIVYHQVLSTSKRFVRCVSDIDRVKEDERQERARQQRERADEPMRVATGEARGGKASPDGDDAPRSDADAAAASESDGTARTLHARRKRRRWDR